MTWVATGVTVFSAGASILGGRSAKKRAEREQSEQRNLIGLEAAQRERDLFAEYDASRAQQQQALARQALAGQAEAEFLRQAGLLEDEVELDIAAPTAQQRAARRRDFFEGTP